MTTFQKNIRLIAEHSLIWYFRLPIKTLFAYQRNQIYSEASSTHFSAINLSYFTIYPLNSSWIYIISDISENYQSYRGTQFNLTLCDLPIKTLLTFQRNQIYSEASSTHFSLIIYHTSRFTHQNAHCSKYITTFQKTIRLLAEHNSNWQFAIYQSIVFSPPNAIKYILKLLQHTFKLLIYHTLTLYPSYSSLIQINHRHFRKLSDFSLNTIQIDNLLLINQKSSLLQTQLNIFWSIFNTLFSY